MARPKKTTPTVTIKACLPEDLAAKVKLLCYSEVEGKIPQGALQEFFVEALTNYIKGISNA